MAGLIALTMNKQQASFITSISYGVRYSHRAQQQNFFHGIDAANYPLCQL
jgi:hypothetical protein